MMNTSIALALTTHPANDTSLPCEACGAVDPVTAHGLCAVCDADLAAGLDALTAGARYYVGDDEGELLARAVRC